MSVVTLKAQNCRCGFTSLTFLQPLLFWHFRGPAFGIWMLSSLSGLTDEQKQWLTLLKVWAILPVLVFSFSQTKNPQYVLLAVPALTSLGALLLTLPIPSEASRELWLLKRRFALLTWFSLTLVASSPHYLLSTFD
jgi:4-amino-4-deoxy-L-arabinose transferase-like glycosyltransferase